MKNFAPLLSGAYAAGDSEAKIIVEEFAEGSARYITAGMTRLGMNGKEMDLVLSGSVFKNNGALIADRIFELVTEKEPYVKKVRGRYEPVCGAALTLLDRYYGGALPQDIAGAFDETACRFDLLRSVEK